MAIKLRDVVDRLKGFRCVVVCGPQRSGTRLMAKIIAKELRLGYVDEAEFGAYAEWKYNEIVNTGTDIVVHAPAAMAWIDKHIESPDVAFVFTVRPLADILASQARIAWGFELKDKELLGTHADNRPVALIKLQKWCDECMGRENCFTVHWRQLEGHPLFVPKEKRHGWSYNQTEP